MTDAQTLRVYEENAREYAEKNKEYLASDPHLAAFINACPTGGHVLDLGCGPGISSAIMARGGLIVDAVDAAQNMVDLAGQQEGVNARKASFDEISGTGVYDGIWANFSLLHAPRSDFPRLLNLLHRALKPGGRFHIGMKLGIGSARDTIGRQYTYFEEDDLVKQLSDAGFTVISRAFGRGEGLDGKMSDWIVLAANA